MQTYATLEDLKSRMGQPIGQSDWIDIPQSRIQQFADATDDHQWIHLDEERAKSGPFKSTIAHGFLTLSLLPRMMYSAYSVTEVGMGVNYGLNRVRFPAPVPAGGRVRGNFKLLSSEPIEGGAQITVEVSVELEGLSKPVCIAESVGRMFVAPAS
jgi:acyl dehydratase